MCRGPLPQMGSRKPSVPPMTRCPAIRLWMRQLRCRYNWCLLRWLIHCGARCAACRLRLCCALTCNAKSKSRRQLLAVPAAVHSAEREPLPAKTCSSHPEAGELAHPVHLPISNRWRSDTSPCIAHSSLMLRRVCRHSHCRGVMQTHQNKSFGRCALQGASSTRALRLMAVLCSELPAHRPGIAWVQAPLSLVHLPCSRLTATQSTGVETSCLSVLGDQPTQATTEWPTPAMSVSRSQEQSAAQCTAQQQPSSCCPWPEGGARAHPRGLK